MFAAAANSPKSLQSSDTKHTQGKRESGTWKQPCFFVGMANKLQMYAMARQGKVLSIIMLGVRVAMMKTKERQKHELQPEGKLTIRFCPAGSDLES